MPNGPTHSKITKFIAISAVSTVFWLDFDQFVALEAGILLTLKANNDLDIHNHLGLVGTLMGFDMYKKLIPHRAGLRLKDWKRMFGKVEKGEKKPMPWQIMLWSHLPCFGTAPRTFLLLFPVVITLAMFNLHTLLEPVWGWWIFIGMSLSDTAHSAADLIDTYQKELNPGWWKNQPTQQELIKMEIKRARAAERRKSWTKKGSF